MGLAQEMMETEATRELRETLGLVRATHRFALNYLATSRRTGDEPMARRAFAQLEEGLIACAREAVERLSPGDAAERARLVVAELARLEAPNEYNSTAEVNPT